MALKRNNRDFTPVERKLFRGLSSPAKIQDYLNQLRINFEIAALTNRSPRYVIKKREAQCLEGAMLAACILQFHGYKPLLLDLRPYEPDVAHVVALFKIDGCFGAISKTNHAVLRFREPVYKTLRELVMSYFHEYFLDDGRKLLLDYAVIDLSQFDNKGWQTSEENLWYVDQYLNKVKHHKILTPKQEQMLRKADALEIAAGKLVEWQERKGKVKRVI